MSQEVQKALQEGFTDLNGNSMASHLVGLAAHNEIEIGMELLANKVGALKSEIIFTSCVQQSKLYSP